MNCFVAVLISLYSVVVLGGAPTPSQNQLCLAGCQTALSLNTYAGQPSIEDGYYVEGCTNRLHVQSIYACGRRYCSPTDLADGIIYLNDVCETYGYISILGLDIVSNLTQGDIDELPTLTYGDTTIINMTTIPEQRLFDLGYRTEAVWNFEKDTHLRYSEAMFIFWGVVIFIGLVSNLMASVLPSAIDSSYRKLWAHFEASLKLVPTFSYHCDETVGRMITIPPRLESIVIVSFVVVNIVLCAVTYELFPDNLYYPETRTQLLRYVADRTGYLSYANLPIFWLFGIRNNILLWITGWDFSTFNRFHRWVARVSTLEAVIHSVTYTIFSFQEGGYAEYAESWTEQYWFTGAIATIAMSLAIGASLMWLRLHYYDLFLITHISLALIVLVNLFYHTSIFMGEYDGFLWPCVAIWIIDRLVRLGRVGYNLIGAKSMKASMEYDARADLVRVELSNVLAHRNQLYAGSHCFLYVVNQLRFWESHPFTIVRWKSLAETGVKKSSDSSEKSSVAHGSVSSEDLAQYHYSLLVRPHRGFTSRLARRVTETSTRGTARLLIEGPYHQSVQHLPEVTNVLFIIGGSGISVAISHIYALLETPSHPAIRLVWSARQEGMLDSVLDRELKAALANIEVNAFVTGLDESKAAPAIHSVTPEAPSINRTNGRPDVEKCITASAEASIGILQVIACGPPSMMNDVRLAVVGQLKGGNTRLRLTMESFAW